MKSSSNSGAGPGRNIPINKPRNITAMPISFEPEISLAKIPSFFFSTLSMKLVSVSRAQMPTSKGFLVCANTSPILLQFSSPSKKAAKLGNGKLKLRRGPRSLSGFEFSKLQRKTGGPRGRGYLRRLGSGWIMASLIWELRKPATPNT
ncbi:hypothetical protein SLEP1_g51985 [Rubroshorea leprosula]|uniref:Uncharacterized protein n=2 Tax=Rubroshorea leprosula TaxID=152421 RepID=A0AAV5M5Y0_9ROSI|nr:hypothetical protein SLEP1_g51985 [Rubroshorea leprosula]